MQMLIQRWIHEQTRHIEFCHTEFLLDESCQPIRSNTVCHYCSSRMLRGKNNQKSLFYFPDENIWKIDSLLLSLLVKLTSSRTMADINAIRRFRFNSRPVESTAADLTYFLLTHLCHVIQGRKDHKNVYLSTSVSKIIPKSALLSRTAWVIAFMATLSSGFGIWFGNKPALTI